MIEHNERSELMNSSFTEEHNDYEGAIKKIGFGFVQIKILIISWLSMFTGAITTMTIALLPDYLACLWSLSTLDVTLMMVIYRIGTISGAIIMGILMKKVSKIYSLNLSVFMKLIGFIILALSVNMKVFDIGAVIMGFGAGGLSLIQSYSIDFFPVEKHDSLIFFIQTSYSCGFLFTTILAYFLILQQSWTHWVLYLLIPIFITLLCLLFGPESPLFHFNHGNTEKCNKILKECARINKSEAIINIKTKDLAISDDISNLSLSIASKAGIIGIFMLFFLNTLSYFAFILQTSKILHGFEDISSLYTSLNSTLKQKQCTPMTKRDFSLHMGGSFGELLAIPIGLLALKFLSCRSIIIISSTIASLCNLIFIIKLRYILNVIFIIVTKIFISISFPATFIFAFEKFPERYRSMFFGIAIAFDNFGFMIAPFAIEYLFITSRLLMIFFTSVMTFSVVMMSCMIPRDI